MFRWHSNDVRLNPGPLARSTTVPTSHSHGIDAFFLPPAARLLQPTCSHITELDKCKKCLEQRCQIIPDKLFDTFVCSCNMSYGCPVVSKTTLVRQCNIPFHLRVSRNDTSENILILRLCPWTETSLFKEINSRQTPNKENNFVPGSQHSEVKRC